MTNISSRKNLWKDAAILLALAALLIVLPWTQGLLQGEDESASVNQGQSQGQSEEVSVGLTPGLAVIQRQRAFIEEAFPKLSSWEVSVLEPYLAKVTKGRNWTTEIGAVLTTLSGRLGQLEHFSEPAPIYIADAPTDELEAYEFEAFYEKGVADIYLVLTDSDGNSALYSFNIKVRDEPLAL